MMKEIEITLRGRGQGRLTRLQSGNRARLGQIGSQA